jgi:hypothetical protein
MTCTGFRKDAKMTTIILNSVIAHEPVLNIEIANPVERDMLGIAVTRIKISDFYIIENLKCMAVVQEDMHI